MSTKSLWKTNHNSNSSPAISYAERLRRANQRTTTKTDTPLAVSPTPSENSKSVNDTRNTVPNMTKYASCPNQKTTSASSSPSPEEKMDATSYTTNQCSSTGSHQGCANVWEERMRQRKVKQSNQATQPQSGLNGCITSPSHPKTEVPNQTLEADPSLEGIPDDTWLQRIYMLNGGERRPRLGLQKAAKSDADREAIHRSPASNTYEKKPFQTDLGMASCDELECTNQPWKFLPTEQALKAESPHRTIPVPANYAIKHDGSYAPHGLSDQPVANMTGLGSRTPYMPSAYASRNPGVRYAPRGPSTYRAPPNRGYDSFRFPQYSSSMPNSATMIPYIIVPSMPVPSGQSPNLGERGLSPDPSKAAASAEEFNRAEDGGDPRSAGESPAPCYGAGSSPYMPYPALLGGSLGPYMVPIHPYMQMPYPNMWPYYGGQPQSAPFAPAFDTNTLLHQLRAQVEFYFSDENLASDLFLRKQMDADGFVQLETILGFKRIHKMLQGCSDGNKGPESMELNLLRTAIQGSSFLSLDAEKMRVRRASNWQSFVFPSEGL